MIKQKTGVCIDCDNGKIVPLIAKRCQYHYWKHRDSLKKKKTVEETKSSSPQKDAMMSLWEKSNKKSEISGKNLIKFYHDYITGKENHQFFWCFAHFLSKKTYTKLKCREDGMMLLHPDEHYLIDNMTQKDRELYEKKNNCSFKIFYDKQALRKKEYNIDKKYD